MRCFPLKISVYPWMLLHGRVFCSVTIIAVNRLEIKLPIATSRWRTGFSVILSAVLETCDVSVVAWAGILAKASGYTTCAVSPS